MRLVSEYTKVVPTSFVGSDEAAGGAGIEQKDLPGQMAEMLMAQQMRR